MKRLKTFYLMIFFVLVMSVIPGFATQHDYNIANGPGAVVRADINNALEAIVTNNSGATEPASTYANMWWFDTSTSILKQRDNANTAWINVAYKNESGWTPYRQGTQLGTVATLTKDIDGTFTANSDSNVATQKATKTYADTKLSKTTAGELSALTEKTTLADNDIVLIEDSEASYAKKKVKKSNLASNSRMQVFTASGTFTAPTGVTYVRLYMVGAGGGGGGGANNGGGGGGGGGSLVLGVPYSVTPGNNYSVTVGSGGGGGVGGNWTTQEQCNAGGNGSAGGNSIFDSTITATGGYGGTCSPLSGTGGAGGTSAGANNGSGQTGGGKSSLRFAGGSGANGLQGGYGGGGGAPAAFGAGADGGAVTQTGSSAAENSGGGGGGGGDWNGSAGNGGGGGSGLVVVAY